MTKMKMKTNPTNRTKKKVAPSDIVLMLMAVFLLFKTPWSNMEGFDFLLLFLYIFCMMMRLSNMRKHYAKEQAVAQAKAEQEATLALDAPVVINQDPVEILPVESVSVEEPSNDGISLEKSENQ